MLETLQFTLANPVLKREMLTGFRSVRLRVVLFLYLAVPFIFLSQNWPADETYFGGSVQALRVWRHFLEIQAGLTILLTPVFAAYLVSSEFELKTAEFLWTTRIPPPLIVLSKLMSVIALGVALQFASLPALSMIFFLGGVGAEEMTRGFLLLLAVMSAAGSVAIFFSTTLKKGHAALVASYIAFAILWGFSTAQRPAGFAFNMAWLATITILATAGTCALARLPVGEKVPSQIKLIKDAAILHQRRYSWPYYVVDPLEAHPPIPDSKRLSDAVAGLETYIHPLMQTSGQSAAVMIPAMLLPLTVVPAIIICLHDAELRKGLPDVLWWVNFVPVTLWTIFHHAVSATMDHEYRTLQGVRQTQILPDDYLAGKWWASLKFRRVMLACALVPIALANLAAAPYPGAFLLAPLQWWLCVEAAGWVAFAVSSWCRNTLMAIAGSLVACVGLALLYRIGSGWFTNRGDAHPSWEQAVASAAVMFLAAAIAHSVARMGMEVHWRRERV